MQIDVVDRSNKPPVWDNAVYGPIYVKENTAVGQTVTSVKARCVLNLPSPLSFFFFGRFFVRCPKWIGVHNKVSQSFFLQIIYKF